MPKKENREKSQRTNLLTILLGLWLLQSNKLRKTLVLVSGHSTVTTTLEGEIELKMLVQMFLESLISDKSHPTDTAVVFASFEYLSLG